MESLEDRRYFSIYFDGFGSSSDDYAESCFEFNSANNTDPATGPNDNRLSPSLGRKHDVRIGGAFNWNKEKWMTTASQSSLKSEVNNLWRSFRACVSSPNVATRARFHLWSETANIKCQACNLKSLKFTSEELLDFMDFGIIDYICETCSIRGYISTKLEMLSKSLQEKGERLKYITNEYNEDTIAIENARRFCEKELYDLRMDWLHINLIQLWFQINDSDNGDLIKLTLRKIISELNVDQEIDFPKFARLLASTGDQELTSYGDYLDMRISSLRNGADIPLPQDVVKSIWPDQKVIRQCLNMLRPQEDLIRKQYYTFRLFAMTLEALMDEASTNNAHTLVRELNILQTEIMKHERLREESFMQLRKVLPIPKQDIMQQNSCLPVEMNAMKERIASVHRNHDPLLVGGAKLDEIQPKVKEGTIKTLPLIWANKASHFFRKPISK